MDTQANVLQTVERLAPRMHRIASLVADAGAGYEAEDAFQDMTLSLLERENQDPVFLKQKDAYILSHCSWDGRNKAQSGRVYSKFNEPENDKFELIVDRTASPEEETEMRELWAGLKKVIESLPVENQRLICLLKAGETPAEIARITGVSRSAISQRLKHIRKSLAGALV